jgi:hypothetical protein
MLKPINLFHTPKDWHELMTWIHAHNDEDKAHLTTAAAMGWNLCATIIEDYLETTDEDT